MTFLYIMAIIVFFVALRGAIWKWEYSYDGHLLSRATRDLIRKWHTIPSENRAVSLYELKQTCYALDVRFGGRKEVHDHFFYEATYDLDKHWHFEDHGRTSTEFDKCAFSEYTSINHEFNRILRAVEERKDAMKQLSIAHLNPDVKLLTQRLREERNIIEEVTKELL